MLLKVFIKFLAVTIRNSRPKAQWASLCMFSASRNQFRSEFFQFDVSSAHLNANLEEAVNVRQPPGFSVPAKASKTVCKLLEGLYGSKEAGRCLNRTLVDCSTEFGLTRSMAAVVTAREICEVTEFSYGSEKR